MANFNDKAPISENPELLDIIIGNIQTGLIDNLPWLDKAFGRAERIVDMDNNRRRVYTPCVYVSGNDYIRVTPDANIGNFCFFWIEDPQSTDIDKTHVGISTQFSIIFWFDFRRIYNSGDTRNKEDLKRQILDTLNTGFRVRSGHFTINRIYELAENIYRGFSLDEVDNQFLMHPFGGFRFEGELSISGPCKY